MNKQTKRSQKTNGDACLCLGFGPALSELLRRLAPPGEACRHFEAARLEFLKGLRAVVDARIEQVAKRRTKGEKINVE